jgi:ABC-type Zn uptake system ZnuABC Zn-binding protein ZnuA
MNKSRICSLVVSVMSAISILSFARLGADDAGKRILATTFPVHQIVRNVAKDSGAELSLLLPAQLGCPHDYALSPQDMMKLAKADILVVNGLGMEEFLGAPVEKANAKIIIVDSSAGIKDTLEYAESCDHADHGHAGHEHHSAMNPHIFASPRMAAKMAMNIADGLAKADPANAAIYLKNGKEYSDKLDKLADEMSDAVKKLKNRKIVQPHGIFDYLARDIGIEIIATMQAHGQEPSAAETLQLIKKIKDEKPGAIVSEPQYPDKMPKTISKETGVPHIKLDPAASGPEDATLDHYERTMRDNMKILENLVALDML